MPDAHTGEHVNEGEMLEGLYSSLYSVPLVGPFLSADSWKGDPGTCWSRSPAKAHGDEARMRNGNGTAAAVDALAAQNCRASAAAAAAVTHSTWPRPRSSGADNKRQPRRREPTPSRLLYGKWNGRGMHGLA